ncbi:MAG: MFS transporter [Candidatus Hermodarchaeia archaeon]
MVNVRVSPLLLISAVSLTSAMSGNILGPVMALYARDYAGATTAEIGLIVSIFSTTSLPSKLLTGVYSRGVGILYIPVVGILVSALCPLGMTLFPSPSMLIVFRAIQGFCNAMIWPSTLTMVALMVTDQRRDQVISSYTSAISIGMFAGPLIGSLSIATMGMHNTFLLSAGISMVSFLLGVALLRFRHRIFSSLEGKEGDGELTGSISHVIKNRSFWSAASVLIALSFVVGILQAYGTLHAKDVYQVRDAEIALVFFGYNGVAMVARLLLGRLLTVATKERILGFSLVNLGIMLFLLVPNSTFPLFTLWFSLLGVSHGVIFPVGAMVLAEHLPRGFLSIANALYTTAWDVGATLGPLVTASLVVQYTYRESLIVAAITPLFVFVASILLRRKKIASELETGQI